jgi:hypothetical protein
VKIRLCASLLLFVASSFPVFAQQQVSIRDTDLGDVVTGTGGPEAGVWVIAETTDLPTKFAKIVVTDDLGRYLIPDQPRANYRVWVRGFGAPRPACTMKGRSAETSIEGCGRPLALFLAGAPGSEPTQMRFDHSKRCEFIRLLGGAAALARADEVCE